MSRKSTSSVTSPLKATNNGIGNEDGWTDAQTKDLLNKIKQVIPKPDVSKYKTMLEKLDWEKVKVAKYSTEECKKQWSRVYKKLRKYKTLTDLVNDSLEYIENPYKGNVKKHPDHPKRPLTPYFRFFLSEREKYAAKHKSLSNLEITSILSKKYREITIEEKEKFMNDWKAEMVDYRTKLEDFKRNHPEYYDKSPPRMSRTPLQIFNQENIATISASKSKKMSKKQVQESLKNKYHDLEDDQKLPYILKAIEEGEKYKEELEMYKKSHSDFVPTTAQTKSTLTISDWRIHDKSLGKPDRPPANGYNLFCTRMMVSDAMKHLTSRERIMQCGQKWKYLTDAEKIAYQSEFLILRDNYRLRMKNFMKSLTPRQSEEYLERKKETETKKNLKRKVPIHVKEEPVSDNETSSEQEEIEVNDDTSSESSSSESTDGEEEEEEEEEEDSGPREEASNITATIASPAPLRPTTPISALFLYQKAHRERFTAKHPNTPKSDITIMLARRFNNLPQTKKAKYIQKEKEQRALYNEQMRKHIQSEQEKGKKELPTELKPVTGEQIFQEQNRANYVKKANGLAEKAEDLMRRAWTHMNKDRRKKYIVIAHEQNAKNIAEHQAAKSAAEKGQKKQKEVDQVPERDLSQKEVKSYLALEPQKVPKDALLLFKMEQKPRLTHLTAAARNQELNRLWSVLPPSNKNKYKERAKAGMEEYNKKLQRWMKSMPPQVHEAYKALLQKKAKTKTSNEKAVVSNGNAKKRKGEPENMGEVAKKAKSSQEESGESSDDSDSDDDSSSSSDSDDSDSSSSDDSSDGSDSSDSEEEKQVKVPAKGKEESSGDSSSSSSSDDSDSD